MPRYEVVGSSINFVAVMAHAEQEGLARFYEQDDGKMGLAVTAKGAEWCVEQGLRGVLPEDSTAADREDALYAFFAFYSREVGLPLVQDETLYEAIRIAELRIEWEAEQRRSPRT